jgi:ribosome-associated protein
VRERLLRLAGSRATADGEIVIEAKRFRTQARNRADAQERLVALIRRAATLPKPRRKTRASAAVKARVLESKRKRGEVKRRRRPVQGTDE